MKAKIEIEIDREDLSDDELKSLLAENLYNICFEWITFDTPPMIEFTDGEIKTKEKSFFKFNWNETKQ
jgi:hypothetical protein